MKLSPPAFACSMVVKLSPTRKLNLTSHGGFERRERWQFDIRLSQCDGLGGIENEVCVQLARHAKVAVSQCVAVAGGSASWADAPALSLVCTLKAQEGGGFDPKLFKLSLQQQRAPRPRHASSGYGHRSAHSGAQCCAVRGPVRPEECGAQCLLSVGASTRPRAALPIAGAGAWGRTLLPSAVCQEPEEAAWVPVRGLWLLAHGVGLSAPRAPSARHNCRRGLCARRRTPLASCELDLAAFALNSLSELSSFVQASAQVAPTGVAAATTTTRILKLTPRRKAEAATRARLRSREVSAAQAQARLLWWDWQTHAHSLPSLPSLYTLHSTLSAGRAGWEGCGRARCK